MCLLASACRQGPPPRRRPDRASARRRPGADGVPPRASREGGLGAGPPYGVSPGGGDRRCRPGLRGGGGPPAGVGVPGGSAGGQPGRPGPPAPGRGGREIRTPRSPRAERFARPALARRRRTFDERVRRLRTERGGPPLPRHAGGRRRRHPAVVATANLLDTLLRGRKLDDLNPVTTAGSMQVSVRWAMAHAKELGMPGEEMAVRDALYTRAGGLRFGVARLWKYPAAYRESLWRFADYNAGEYAARNAAIQRALGRLTAVPVAADGDLVAFGPDGQPRPEDSDTTPGVPLFKDKFAPTLSEAPSSGGTSRRARARAGAEARRSPRSVPRVPRARPASRCRPRRRARGGAEEAPSSRRGYTTTAAYARSVESHNRSCLRRLRENSAPASMPSTGAQCRNPAGRGSHESGARLQRMKRSGSAGRRPPAGESHPGDRTVAAPQSARGTVLPEPGRTERAGAGRFARRRATPVSGAQWSQLMAKR